MFVSANFLAINYGVDDTIAKFFTDRQPPANNLYWKDKLMYLRPEIGWLFIPLIVDLLYKSGIPREHLLSEDYVAAMEHIGHISAREEIGEISPQEAVVLATDFVSQKATDEGFLADIVDFVRDGTNNRFKSLSLPFKALHRGDLFLFSLVVLPIQDELEFYVLKCWFALISTLLLLDDADDLELDKANGHENAFIQSGLDQEGVNKIKTLVKTNLAFIAELNRPMASTLDKKFVALSKRPEIFELLNQ
ncbi:hypothetical protein EXU57_23925 [Segetibacter sp. 3557_3]|uniref:hypothetical protein n=1 Tax=Segetibacter sp. 3557_3 TaxID=2547429 RepID=UPI00105843CE|nr:hypothetical protein [Segetibacter sp. 3557_3]TDH18306.1 hypothetical protein EXU57_23925 [Segetibacter sp. 3557_3]